MPRGTEDVLQEELWSWLTEQGYEVAGEVGVNDGFVDLVAKADNEYVGFELKTIYGLTSQAGFSLQSAASALEQIQGYIRSSSFDRFYFCCEYPEKVKQRMADADDPSLNQSSRNSALDQLGLIQVSLAIDDDIEVIKEADKLNRKKTPELPRDNEAWVNHHVWKWARETKQTATREGFLPGGEYYVDVSAFDGTTNTTEILNNQDQYSHIGIESKGAGGVTPDDELSDQLMNYLESGGLTHLYLAVPEQRREQVDPQTGQQTLTGSSALEIPQNVGIITVDETGEVQVTQKAERVKMEYDGIRWSDSEYVPVGLGARDKQQKDAFENISHWYYHNHTLY